MRHREAFAEAFVERKGDALAHAARSDEDQRCLMLVNLGGDAVVNLAPHLFARHWAEFVAGNFDRQLHFAAVPDVDDRRTLAQELRHLFQRTHGRRKPDSLRFFPGRLDDQVIQARERERQMRTALVRCHRMNLVDDHRRNAGEERARLLGRQQDIKRLGRRDQYVRRLSQHALALGRRGIAGAHGRANGRHRQAPRFGKRGQSGKRLLQVLADVVGQRLEGRDVDHERLSGSVPSVARRTRSSKHSVKAASVFPEPVGAEISTSSPARIAGQPWSCGSVAAVKLESNHSRTSGWKSSRISKVNRPAP